MQFDLRGRNLEQLEQGFWMLISGAEPSLDPMEDRRVQEAMFSALTKILAIDSLSCQLAALHGLGHLRHPNTETAIRTYLARSPTLAEDHRRFAVACITGDM
jgi:hypothetical protein